MERMGVNHDVREKKQKTIKTREQRGKKGDSLQLKKSRELNYI